MTSVVDGHRPALASSGQPTISVIVPAYDADRFLTAALASLAGQSRKPDEVVVVDDGSTDATAAVAAQWSGLLPLVVVRSEDNRGLGAARRLGIERSRGDLIALLDADDYLMPDHLAVMEAAWLRHGGVIAAEDYRWLPGARLGTTRWAERVIPPPPEQARRILQVNFGCYCSLFSREDYDEAGGFRALRKSEDWDLWIRMVRHGTPLTPAPTTTLMYRKRLDSLSASDGCLEANIQILEDQLGQVADNDRAVLARSLRRHRARREFLAAYDEVAAGRIGQARWRWLKAAVLDRSLRAGALRTSGSVAIRSLVCIIVPRWVLARRERRQTDPGVLTT